MNEESKNLKNKLLKAKSKDEFTAVLAEEGLSVREDQIDMFWEKHQALMEAEEITALDDEELEAVAGGTEYAADGHEIGCIMFYYWDNDWARESCCPNNPGKWTHNFVTKYRTSTTETQECTYCGYQRTHTDTGTECGHDYD